jgi:CheY-like chemotaxis protein
MLGHEMKVISRPAHGSSFSISVPLASPESIAKLAQPSTVPGEHSRLEDLLVLCIDNEPDILEGMELLLDRWGCRILLAENEIQARQQVLESGVPDLALVDYHLAEQSNGLEVLKHIDDLLGTRLPAIVITADRSADLEEAVRKKGYGLLRKPIKPAALRALMTNTLKSLPPKKNGSAKLR